MSDGNTKKVDITVIYKYVGGAHFFTSNHKYARGLCAASVDLKAAYEDVPVQVTELLKDNHGIEGVSVAHEQPFESFEKELLGAMMATLKARAKKRDTKEGASPPDSAVVVNVGKEMERA